MIYPTLTSKEFAQTWLVPFGVSILVNILFNRWQANRSCRQIETRETPKAIVKDQSATQDQIRDWIETEVRSQTIQLYSSTSPRSSKRSNYPPVAQLPSRHQLRILVTGGAGFVGSHLVDRLMMQGHRVIVVDNMFTGRAMNVQQWQGHPNFQLIIHDIVEPIFLEVDQIYHLACPASPPHYQYNPIKTIKTNTQGTLNMLGLAKRVGARILLTSTSEVYGDPEIHPQKETYWGNVNPIGPRACYDEGKRVAETMM
jgi:FlaA1/EpsC-like NDP-sugar epimerase